MLWLEREDLPESIDVNGTTLPIFADFRTWVRVDSVIQDNAIPEELKLPVICDLIGINPFAFKGDQKDLWDAILGFYFCDKKPKESYAKTNGRQGYRFEYDMDLIYAAFRQQYNINLLDAKLHWFEFKALFNALSDDTMIIRVIGYRTRDTSNLKEEEKSRAQRLERYYRLPEDKGPEKEERTPQEIEAELLARLET